MTTYKAVLVAPDGDWVTDYAESESVEAVEEALCDQGSRWYFYPFHGVIRDNGPVTTDRQRLVSCAWPFEHLTGRTVRTFRRTIAATPESELEEILRG